MKKRPEQTKQTQNNIEEAFWRLYKTMPIEHITVGSVCELAGYNRGTFYSHYHDLYELLSQCENRILGELAEHVESCMKRLNNDQSKPTKIAALAELVMVYEKNKTYLLILLGEKGDFSFLAKLKDKLKPLWRQYVVEDTAGRSEQEIDLILEYILSGSLFMVSRWLQNPGTISAFDLGKLIYDSAIRNVQASING